MNRNCLSGCGCPKCGSEGPFQVVATSVFLLTDDGTEGHQAVEYDGGSAAYCTNCDWTGTWAELSTPKTTLQGSVVRGLTINVPQFFADHEFVDWLNGDSTTDPIMTWHQRPFAPTEWSDVVVLVDPSLNGEGADASMPEHLWAQIVAACREAGLGGQHEHIPVRLTNLSETC